MARLRVAAGAGVAVFLLVTVVLAFPMAGPAIPRPATPPAAIAQSGTLLIQSFSYSPSPVSAGTSTQGMIQVSGGTPPYFVWLNNTPPGCAPPSTPLTMSGVSTSFSCNPSTPGSYTIHLDLLDSGAPVAKASQSTSLTVNGNNHNTNGSGNKNGGGNGSSILPSGLLTVVTLLAVVFLGALVAVAVGVIALAAIVSRRLRQLNETLAKMSSPPEKAKPPG
ncbi:MAG TPA: hypothetical protein VJQ43_05810 [Thermoplasmata archaeon]|nr:hypothetical protein [Thermoplasmata archaeon]